MPAPGTLLCRWNLVISNNTRSLRHYKKIIPACLIWGNTVFWDTCTTRSKLLKSKSLLSWNSFEKCQKHLKSCLKTHLQNRLENCPNVLPSITHKVPPKTAPTNLTKNMPKLTNASRNDLEIWSRKKVWDFGSLTLCLSR